MATPTSPLPADRVARRAALADEIARIVLEEGLSVLALRGLAARLGTSGRMLLYYFDTKEALVLAALARIGDRMTSILDARTPEPLATPGALLGGVLSAVALPEIAPFMRVWTEVVARGARGEAPYDGVATRTVGVWIDWIESRLLPECRGGGEAAAILSIVDGVTLLELARPGTTALARTLLPRLLDGRG